MANRRLPLALPENKVWTLGVGCRPQIDPSNVTLTPSRVSEIISDVRQRGDFAVLDLTYRFDRVNLKQLEVPLPRKTFFSTDEHPNLVHAVKLAESHLRQYHQQEVPRTVIEEWVPGAHVKRRFLPFDRVGVYVPGGRFPLLSSLLMSVIPAQVAGCREIVVCSPPQSVQGQPHQVLIDLAAYLGVQRFFCCGGAQAVAAMAYGTQTVPQVDKIVGPGNAFVAEAKTQVSRDVQACSVDLPAGPSEIVIVADGTANPEFVAWDLLAQAEHGPDSLVALISWDERVLVRVKEALLKALDSLPDDSPAFESLHWAGFWQVLDWKQALDFVEDFAPEHLSLQMDGASGVVDSVNCAGSVSVGSFSATALGDYVLGSNHVLPTSGWARSHSGLGVEAFGKWTSVHEISPQASAQLAQPAQVLAEFEGLVAHAASLKARVEGV